MRHRLVPPVEPRDPEVEHLHEVGVLAAVHEHHVLGLQIAMRDPLRVRFADRVADLERDVERARQRHRAPRRRERALEREPVEVLHHDVERAIGELAGEVHLHHVRMLKARRDLGLAMEARHQLLVRAELAMEDLHRDVAIDPLLERAVHAPHGPHTGELTHLDVPRDLAPDVRSRLPESLACRAACAFAASCSGAPSFGQNNAASAG